VRVCPLRRAEELGEVGEFGVEISYGWGGRLGSFRKTVKFLRVSKKRGVGGEGLDGEEFERDAVGLDGAELFQDAVVGGFEALEVAHVEFGGGAGFGVVERVKGWGLLDEFFFEAGDAAHAPTGADKIMEELVLDGADGVDEGAHGVVEIVELLLFGGENCPGGESVAAGVLRRVRLAGVGARTGGVLRVGAISIDLSLGSHGKSFRARG
jgi:hypothetical protein